MTLPCATALTSSRRAPQTPRTASHSGGYRWVAAAAVLLLASCATTGDSAGIDESEAAIRAAVEQEIEVGKSVVAKLAGQYGLVQDTEATEYLNKFVATLGLFVSRQELTFRAGILETDQVNAFALPGGYLLFTRGVLKEVDNPSTLAGVIAHELGHTDLRHILEQVHIEVDYSVVETLARLLAGPRQVMTQAVDQINDKIAERLFLEGYAQDDEYDADEYAVRLLQGLGIDARPYRNYLAGLADSADAELESLDQTHPPLTERVAQIDALLVEGLEPLPVTEEFQAFSERLRAMDIPEESL